MEHLLPFDTIARVLERLGTLLAGVARTTLIGSLVNALLEGVCELLLSLSIRVNRRILQR